MTNRAHVKIGITHASREIEVDVDDADAFVSEFEAALADGRRVWWVEDSEGRRHGVILDKIAYLDIESERDKTVGFG
jgi:hypothetical protein